MIKVLKFGGTSVGSAQNMKRVAEIVRREQATVTVLSAMSGTTDALVQISKLAADGDSAAIGKVLDMLRDKYGKSVISYGSILKNDLGIEDHSKAEKENPQ